MRHMVIRTPVPTGYAGVRLVEVSLPYVGALIGEKYMEPGDVKPLQGIERRRQRVPSLHYLVKLVVRRANAEQQPPGTNC